MTWIRGGVLGKCDNSRRRVSGARWAALLGVIGVRDAPGVLPRYRMSLSYQKSVVFNFSKMSVLCATNSYIHR